MSADLNELTRQLPEGTEARVERTVQQMRAKLRAAMDGETRLKLTRMSHESEKEVGLPIPIQIFSGYLKEVKEVLDSVEDLELWMLVTKYRGALRATSGALPQLKAFREQLQSIAKADKLLENVPSTETLDSLQKWLEKCLEQEEEGANPIAKILKIEDDILGVYRCYQDGSEERPNTAQIRIYWAVIGLVALDRGWDVEALTIVVLTHELGHAFTQLGADIDGRRWAPQVFAGAELSLKEGLAQYFTGRVLEKIKRSHPKALKVFDELTKCQSKPYQVHKAWASKSPESVRRAMVEVRRLHKTTLEDFQSHLEQAEKGMNPH